MKSYDELKQLIDQRGVHAVFGDAGEGWAIEQNAEELATFLLSMQALGVTSVLEIGTGYRAGLARFLHDDMGWRVTSVDIHDYGHTFEGITFINPIPPTTMAFNAGDFTSYDLVLIDGDHTYEAVKNDHQLWGKYATKVIAFHDIAGLRECEGVRDYWNEITWFARTGDGIQKYSGFYEIIAEGEQCGGIGYIVLSELAALNELNEAELERTLEAVKAPVKKPTPRKPAAKKPAARKAPVKK